MLRILKWLGLSLLALVAAAVLFVWVQSSRVIDRTYDVPLEDITAFPTDSESVAEGKRLALTRGCYDGCHGTGLSGGVFMDEPGVARIVAPNLTRVAAEYTDAELARAIRHGVRKDGRSTWVMPSSMFHHLSDIDLGLIIAFIRSQPRTDGPLTEVQVGPLARLGIVLGQYNPEATAAVHAAERLHRATAMGLPNGDYIAFTSCTECHGPDLKGSPGPPGPTPSLTIAESYSDSAFLHFMRTGKAMGEREVGLMSEVARGRFAHFTDLEISMLHDYLRTMSRTRAPATAAR